MRFCCVIYPELRCRPLLQRQLIRQHGNELTVRRLILLRCYAAAERLVERINASPAPRDLNGVANGALHLAGGSVVALADARIQLLRDAVDHVGERLSEVSMFGDAITRTDIPIIDIINRLIEKLKHSIILDYLLLDTSLVECDEVMSHFKTFSNKALDELTWCSPSETDGLIDYIYESLHNNSYMKCVKPEAITIEGYVEYIADWLTDKIEGAE